MQARILALFLLLPGLASAQDLPALYDVTGVAANDVLNVRAGPSASDPIVGMLAPAARDVEITVLSDNGWGRTNTGEAHGWVSMRYLARAPQSPWHAFGQPLTCGGTEPFWSLRIAGAALRLDRPDAAPETAPLDWHAVPTGQLPRVAGFGGAGPFHRMSGVIRAADCSDGMSDRAFGLSVDLFLVGAGVTGYSGCCTVTR